MRRHLVFILSVLLCLNCCACGASKQDKSNAKILIVDQDDVLVEYRGISKPYHDCLMIEFYIENNSDDDITMIVENDLVNGCYGLFSNRYADVPAHAKFLTSSHECFMLFDDNLEDYEIESIEMIQFDLVISPTSSSPIITLPVQIDMTGESPQLKIDSP